MEQSELFKSIRDYTLRQLYALAVFNYATGNLLLNQSWLKDNESASQYRFCYWSGIECEGGYDITALVVPIFQIDGSLPPEIGLLTSLTDLYLSDSSFTGTLPTEIGLLTSLNNLDFSSNTFTGTLPTVIGLLTSLNNLDFSPPILSLANFPQ